MERSIEAISRGDWRVRWLLRRMLRGIKARYIVGGGKYRTEGVGAP